MSTIFLYFEVENFERFKRVFDSYQGIRTGHGITSHRIYQDVDDPNRVTISVDIVSEVVASGLLSSSKMQAFLDDAGARSRPAAWVAQAVEDISYARPPFGEASLDEALLIESETIL